MNLKSRNAVMIGGFSYETDGAAGGSDKAKALIVLFKDLYKEMDAVSTMGWKKRPISLYFKILKAIKKADDVYFCVNTNGTRYMLPAVMAFCRKKNKRFYYFMVGIGNLVEEPKNKDFGSITSYVRDEKLWVPGDPKISKILNKMDGILVETDRLRRMIQTVYSVKQVYVVDNHRPGKDKLHKVSDHNPKEKTRFVFFARVIWDKGYDIYLEAAKLLNDWGYGGKFEAHAYGLLLDGDKPWFDSLLRVENFEYKGLCKTDKVKLLSSYDAMVFPTRSYEGTPGTIVDARFAGIPVISSQFTFHDDLVKDGVDGIVLKENTPECIAAAMRTLIDDKHLLFELKKGSLRECDRFLEAHVLRELAEVIG